MEVLDAQNTPVQSGEERTSVMSVGEWMLVMLILAIPFVNIVMLFVWAFGDSTNKTKANYCKATLIWMLISLFLVLILVFTGVMAALSTAMMLW